MKTNVVSKSGQCELSDERTNIVIGEASGFEWWHCPTSGIEIDAYGQLLKLRREWRGWIRGKRADAPAYEWHQTYLPDYCNDLNAIQAAVNMQTPEFQMTFSIAWIEMALQKQKRFHQLTAREWCEVFLRVADAQKLSTFPPLP